MTHTNEHDDNAYIDSNLGRLLELGEPIPGMPEDLKNQIRSRLVQIAPEQEKKSILTLRWAMLPLAAAAALVLFLLFPWKGDLNGSISWADVQKQLEQVRSVSYKICIWRETPTGEQETHCSKVYHKDPGLTRAEIGVSASEVVGVKPGSSMIHIFRREPGRADTLVLNLESHNAYLETQLFFVEDGREPPFNLFINTVSMSWKKMKEITEDKTRIIGDRVINGIPTVGFSLDGLPAETIYFPENPAVKEPIATFGELWVNRKDGTPVRAEIEAHGNDAIKVRHEYTDIQWNIPLEESLFNLDVPVGWHLNKRQIIYYNNMGKKLAPGVTLNSYAPGQESMITAEDVVGIVRAKEISNIDRTTPYETIITIELRQEAAQRLRDYAEAHPDSFIRVKIDDQLNAALALKTNHPNRLAFDLMGLYLPLLEVEEKYFTASTESN
jgi:outer membrane lipoprotein-sorting protein